MNIMIISGWADGSLRGHNSVDGAEIFEVVDAHHGGVTCVAAAPLYIVTGGEDSTVRGSVWAVCGEEREEEEARARARRSARNMISLSRVHTLSFFLSLSLLSAALSLLFSLRLRYTMQVRLWRNSGGRDMLCAFHDHRAKITCVVADRHHDHIVHTSSAEGLISTYDLRSQRRIALHEISNSCPWDIAQLPQVLHGFVSCGAQVSFIFSLIV